MHQSYRYYNNTYTITKKRFHFLNIECDRETTSHTVNEGHKRRREKENGASSVDY